ncbi:MAG: nitroreductase family protein [Deferrisomatales bacterium]|nr:nitroreductase family protein [Deferrisomatales bacterium]
MDTLEAIGTRRSVRHFTRDPIAEDDVHTLLQAAMAAPSSANQQAWHLVVVDRRELLDQIPTFHAYCAFLHEAPLAVVVCGDLSRERSGGRFWVQDCSAATQNLLPAAHALGLGGCWAAVYPIEERIDGLRRLLHLPEHLVPLNVVAIGHPSRLPRPAARFDPARVSWNAMG